MHASVTALVCPHLVTRSCVCEPAVLAKFPDKYIYEPWTAPLSVQKEAGCVRRSGCPP